MSDLISKDEAARRRMEAEAFLFAFNLARIQVKVNTAIPSIRGQFPALNVPAARRIYRKARNSIVNQRTGSRRHA